MNSRNKGKRGERLWRDRNNEHGFPSRRGQQYCGGSDSPDVISETLPNLHQEVKFGGSISLPAAVRQATKDADGKPWIVAHKRNNQPWLVTMHEDTYFALLKEGCAVFQTFPVQMTQDKSSEYPRGCEAPTGEHLRGSL